jgi:hypothetical protein
LPSPSKACFSLKQKKCQHRSDRQRAILYAFAGGDDSRRIIISGSERLKAPECSSSGFFPGSATRDSF